MSRSRAGATRRRFLGGAVAAGLATAAIGESAVGPGPAQANREREIETDVLVVGGGTAGAIAAIQAGRLGISTVLVEAGSQLGGTMTTGGVEFPGLFFAWGKQVVAGIGWELVKKTVALQGGVLPDFSRSTGTAMWEHPQFQVSLSGGLYAALAEEECVAAGVRLRYYEFPVEIREAARGWSVSLAGKGTRIRVQCRQLVDCTGNASAVALAGFQRLRGEERQPGSIVFTLNTPSGWKHGTGYKHQRYVLGADVTTSETHTEANIRGRQLFLRAFREIKEKGRGQDVQLIQLQPETASRETWRILGQTVISKEDYESGRMFEDAVATMYYPIDIHTPSGVEPRHLPEGTVVKIPLGALIPKDSRNLLAAGRCVSSDRPANSGLRVQASCMAMGQAAGAAAALAARRNGTPAQVPIAELRQVLKQHGAIVPASDHANSMR